jgi:hypothetical protein
MPRTRSTSSLPREVKTTISSKRLMNSG